MAALPPTDYSALRQALYSAGAGKEELKARANLPTETQLLAAFQAIEDFWETNKASLKSSIDSAIGFTTPAALARKIGMAWLRNKFERGNN